MDKTGKPLPQETVDNIMHLYHNRIERRCKEVGLTVEEEEQWDPEFSNINVEAFQNPDLYVSKIGLFGYESSVFPSHQRCDPA